MRSGTFFDSNVPLYTLFVHDPRQAAAKALLAKGGVISVQVLNEFAVVARRKLKLSWPEITESIAALRALCPPPLPLTVATHKAGLKIAARYGFRLYDAMIVASALEAGCATLLSEDLQHGQVIDGRLRIRNPFRQPD